MSFVPLEQLRASKAESHSSYQPSAIRRRSAWSPSALVQSPSENRSGLPRHQADDGPAQAPYHLRRSAMPEPMGMLERTHRDISHPWRYLHQTLPLLFSRDRPTSGDRS